MHPGAATPMHAWGSQTPMHPGATPLHVPATPSWDATRYLLLQPACRPGFCLSSWLLCNFLVRQHIAAVPGREMLHFLEVNCKARPESVGLCGPAY